jgi:hypothetical protein
MPVRNYGPVFDLLRAGRSRHDLAELYSNVPAVANEFGEYDPRHRAQCAE